MLLNLIILTLLQSCVFIDAESLLDLPLSITNRNILLHATLTDTYSGDIYFMEEFISANDVELQGKIEIESKTDSSEVHYSADKTSQVLVVQDTACDLYTYKSGWDKKLPGVTKPLLNLILLVGPSIVYRVNHGTFSWTTAPDADVRGTTMHGKSITMNQRLKMTFYYKTNVDINEATVNPSRIVFEGYDPGAAITTIKETLIMDIYLHRETYDELDTIAQIPAGIGCPVYLAKNIPFPSLSARQIQMTVIENVNGPTTSSTENEYYIDDDNAVMRLLTTSLGIKTDAIYDYNLGIIYVKETKGCLTSPLTGNSPGVNQYGYYSLSNLLWLDKAYLYLGQLDFEHRSSFRVKAWEAIEYDTTVSSTKYDKVVTTLYFSESSESTTFNGYVLIGATQNCYSKGSANDYILVATITRDFYNFKSTISEDEFDTQFQLGDCFPSADSKIRLSFQVTNSDSNYNLPQEKPFEFKKAFKSAILSDRKISPLRVSNIDLQFSSDNINVIMTFLSGPNIEDPFRKRSVQVSQDFLWKLAPLTANDEKACLTLQASLIASIKTVLYCSKSPYGNCYHLEGTQTVVTDSKGLTCSEWDFPLDNLYRVGHELTLDEIHKNMLDKTKFSSIAFYGYRYKVVNVLDVTQAADEDTQFPYAVSRHSNKLKADQKAVTTVPGATNFGSCYRACVQEDENLCETFSYCEYGNEVECLVTSTMYDKIDDTVVDSKCNIYSKNHLYDYDMIKNRRFVTSTSVAVDLPLYDCATFCYASEECYSFQFCNGHCTFAGYYTDSGSEYYTNCAIYNPKVASKYQVTGDKTVKDTFHTEFNLNMEQCAALCDDWGSDDEQCKSFNFCPKGRTSSSCYLSKYTVKDGETMQSGSDGCYNYELIAASQKKDVAQNSESVSGTSSGAAFGIIMLFLVGGLVVGFVAPIVYKRFDTLPSLRSMIGSGRATITPKKEGPGWTRQVDDEDQSRV